MPRGADFDDWVAARDADVVARVSQKKEAFKRPLTDNHRRYMAAVADHAVTVCVGPAGTGKTSLACQVAARLVGEGKVRQIVITRPLVECGGSLGTLPGGVEEKMAMFIAPMVQALKRALGPEAYDRLRREGRLEVVPLEQMRGRTFDDAVVVSDESQNAGYSQLHMMLTRLGHDSRMVVCGDLRQSDLAAARADPDAVPLLKVARRLNRLGRPDIAVVVLTRADVLRPDIVSVIDEALGGPEDGCDSSQHSKIFMMPGSTEPAPSYGAPAATPARRSWSSSASSKGQGS